MYQIDQYSTNYQQRGVLSIKTHLAKFAWRNPRGRAGYQIELARGT
jgi:hypothetical protein